MTLRMRLGPRGITADRFVVKCLGVAGCGPNRNSYRPFFVIQSTA